MPAKFCATKGCYEVAVKTARRDDLCRAHQREAVTSVPFIRVQVVGPAEVTDARTQIAAGQGSVVELDPVETTPERLAALVAAGHVKVLSVPGDEPADAKPTKKA